MKLLIQKIYPDAKIPTRGYTGDAGMDFYAYGDFTLKPGERVAVPTGIKMAIPEGYVGLVWDKSGVAIKNGIKTLGGVVDAGYRGEIMIGMINLSQADYTFHKGDKVAQMLIQKFEAPELLEGDLDADTHRGENGFGSSGVN